MFLLAAANPWIYWLAFLLAAGAGLMIIALVIGYLVKVVAAKYPRQQPRR
jgi:preprotein translocase subunit Sss1